MNIREIINEDTVDVGIGITILIDLSQPNTPNATHLTRSTHDFVHHRRSEIAVRKVYGATTRQIVEMLNMRYVWIVLGCFVVAAPVAWYITSRWLESFANRIAQPWWLYLAALVIVLAVTVGLVTLRSLKAATEYPADVVKSN